MLTQEEALKLFEYKDGVLYWREDRSTNKCAGKIAGSLRSDMRRTVRVHNILYLVHRVVYLMHRGYMPEFVDHINGNPQDNRIVNLRAASRSENNRNRRVNKTSGSGVKGVRKQKNRWRVDVRVNGKKQYIGMYATLAEAELAAVETRAQHHGEFARHN